MFLFKENFLVDSAESTKEVEEILQDFLNAKEVTVAECGSAEFGQERFSTVCSCHHDCHSGWRIPVAEIRGLIIVPEKIYKELRDE